MKPFLILSLVILPLITFSQQKLILYNPDYLKYIKIEEIPSNQEQSDFGPCIVDGKLIFSSLTKNDSISKKNKVQSYYKLYSVNIDNSGKVTSIRQKVIGMFTERHLGPDSYNNRTGELMVTRNNTNDPFVTGFVPFLTKLSKLEMVVATQENGKWNFTKPFNQNSREYSVGQPAFTPSGDTLIFVSDMPGGFGGTDLYMSIRLTDGWSHPKNLGPRINTAGKEFTPFVTSDGVLIFASNGRENKADFDLYFTPLNPRGDTAVERYPAPVNSDYDDLSMVVDRGGSFGYFTSNRPGGTGSDDIYRIDFNLVLVKIKGQVVNKVTGKPVYQADLKFNPSVTYPANTSSDPDGQFEVTAPENSVNEITASKEGYKTETVKSSDNKLLTISLMPEIWLELSIKDVETKESLNDVNINFNGDETITSEPDGVIRKALTGGKGYYIRGTHPGYLDNSITIGAEGEPGIIRATLWMYKAVEGKTFVLENIYYDFDKWDILPQSARELDKLVTILKENPGLKVELASYADSRGSEEYNEGLSEKRSAAAVSYITGKGISADNITAKSYGESRPFIANPKNESEYRLNRRTTFTILETGSPIPKYTSVPADQSMYGKYSVPQPENGKKQGAKSSQDIPSVNVTGINYRVQFYAAVKQVNINTEMPEITKKFSRYGLIDVREGSLVKYQIGPFKDQDEGTSVYNQIRDLGYQVMLLEYENNNRLKMILPNK